MTDQTPMQTPTKTLAKLEAAKPAQLSAAFHWHQDALRGGLVDARGRLLATAQVPLKVQTTRGMVGALVQLLATLASSEVRHTAELTSFGLAVEGAFDVRSERLTIPQRPGWTRVALRQQLERACQEEALQLNALPGFSRTAEGTVAAPALHVVTPLQAQAAAEAWTGAARGFDHVIYVALGDTIATGIISEGRAVRGAGGLAGAIGWLAVGTEFKPEYTQQGALLAEAGQPALVRRALEEYGGEASSMLGNLIMTTPEQLTPALIVRAARGGEKLANQVVAEHARWLGRGLANLISLFNPEAIVLGGTLGHALLPFYEEIRAEARRWAHPEAARECRIVSAKLEADMAILQGAARLAHAAIK